MKDFQINYKFQAILYFIKLLLFLFFLILLIFGILSFVFDIDTSKCEMTYMFEYPEYKEYKIPAAAHNSTYQWYGLYRYGEGASSRYLHDHSGIPVLFIPGHGGSHKQVRSLASVSRQMSLRDTGGPLFDFFSVDLNDELSVASGTLVKRQIEFVALAIEHLLLRVYRHKGIEAPLLLMGHSMGGFVARASLLQLKPVLRDSVRLILALASPLETLPIAGLDRELVTLYETVNMQWRASNGFERLAVLSVSGGSRDLVIWDGWGRVTLARHSLAMSSRAIHRSGRHERAMPSCDHRSVLWCRQLVLSLARSLHNLQEVLFASQSTKDGKNMLEALRTHLLAPPVEKRNCIDKATVPDTFWRLLTRPVTMAITSKHTCITLEHWTASVTRLVRLKIIQPSQKQCPSRSSSTPTLPVIIRVSLDGVTHTHYSTDTGSDESVMVQLPGQAAPLLHLELPDECPYHVQLRSSLIDWTAQLIRVHSGRLPSLVAAHLILGLSEHDIAIGAGDRVWSRLQSGVTVIAMAWVALVSGWIESGLGVLWARGHIDLPDLVLLVALSDPVSRCLVTITRVLLSVLALVVRPCLGSRTPRTALLISCLAPSVVLMLVTPRVPVLSLVTLALGFSIAVACRTRLPSHWAATHLDGTVAMVLKLLALLEAAPTVAHLHSSLQHDSMKQVILQYAGDVTSISRYSVSGSFLVLVIALIVYQRTETPLARSPLVKCVNWAGYVVMATGCLIHGAVDIFLCSTFLITALLFLSTTRLVPVLIRST